MRTIAYDQVFDTKTDNYDDLQLYDAAARAHGHVVLAADRDRRAGGATYVLGGVAHQRAGRDRDRRQRELPVEDGDGCDPAHPRLRAEASELRRRRPPQRQRRPAAPAALRVLRRRLGRGSTSRGRRHGPDLFLRRRPAPGVASLYVPASALRGRIVVVGATADATSRTTHTVGGWAAAPMSGPEIEADAIATLMTAAPLRSTSSALDWLAIVLAAVILPALAGAAPALAAPRRRAGLAVAVALLVSAQLAFDAGTIVLLVAPLVALIVAGSGAILIPLVFERRELVQLRALRDRFARFDPSIVDAVLSDPGVALRVRAMAIGPESVIAGYRLVSLIGRGGMGVVYEGVQLTLERPVALKLIDPAHADDDEFRARFVRESHVAAALEHPHVIPVYEAREDDGLLFIAMRLVRGPSLADVLAAQAPLPPARAATIVAQIAAALGAAHAQGLVHRDVKPANVLLHEGEHAYLTDFGITREISGDGLTAVGERIGTVDYMSPEQCRGEPVTPAADIYALGCVLYEALTGRVPFPAGSEAMRVAAHLQLPPPIASEHWPSVPPELDIVILTALAKDPGAALRDRPMSSRPP